MELTNLSALSLTESRRVWERYGLTLSHADAVMLVYQEADALGKTGRVRFGSSVLEPLARAFCDSPYIQPGDWADTLAQLTALFYDLKNETGDALDDEALIAAMAARFNGEAGGSLDALAATEPNRFFRFNAKGGRRDD